MNNLLGEYINKRGNLLIVKSIDKHGWYVFYESGSKGLATKEELEQILKEEEYQKR